MNIWSWLRLRGNGAAPKDFPRSKDVHYIPRLLLTNLNEVNLHLRFLVNPALFKELVQAAAQSLTTKGIGAKPF